MPARSTIILTFALLPLVGCISNRFTRAVERADRAAQRDADPAATPAPDAPVPTPPDDPGGDGPVSVLTINKQQITVEDVLKPIRGDLEDRARRMPPADYGRYLVKAVQTRVQTLARDALVYQEAAKDLTERDETYINDLVEQQIRTRVNSEFAGRQARFERALAEQDRSLADERADIRRQLVMARWLQLTISRQIADPTRDQLWKIYQARRDTLVKPPRRDMLIVEIDFDAKLPDLLATTGTDPRDPPPSTPPRRPTPDQRVKCRDMALRDARAARAELLAGADFADVARKYSTGWHKRSGGRFGWITRDGAREHLAPAVEALFQLPDTDTPSEIIETPDAFFIVQAADIDPGHQPDFASVQPELVDRYRQSRFNERVERFIDRLRRDAQIRPKNINRFLLAVAQAAPQPGAAASP